jgi:NAD(P)-dependent dehydrogenase (short-subunit alcohol dehydrogenase family)
MDLKGSVAAVIGGATGIGSGICRALAAPMLSHMRSM